MNLHQERCRVDNLLHTKLFRIYKIILDIIKDKMYNFINDRTFVLYYIIYMKISKDFIGS